MQFVRVNANCTKKCNIKAIFLSKSIAFFKIWCKIKLDLKIPGMIKEPNCDQTCVCEILKAI